MRNAYKDRLIEKQGATSTLLDDVMHKMKEENDVTVRFMSRQA